jgi:hypothetical protein
MALCKKGNGKKKSCVLGLGKDTGVDWVNDRHKIIE